LGFETTLSGAGKRGLFLGPISAIFRLMSENPGFLSESIRSNNFWDFLLDNNFYNLIKDYTYNYITL